MNFLAHLEVARRRGGDTGTAVLLGSMLPDLISATSLRFGPLEHWPAAVASGIDCHRRADEAFHAHRRFVTGMTAIRSDLMDSGWARGPARAAAHVAWEILLDSTLLDASATRAGYLGALATPASQWAPYAPFHDPRPWRQVVDRYRAHGLPGALDVGATAQRVVDLLGRRPRLAVDEQAVPALTAVLGAHRPAVVAASDTVIEDTIRRIDSPGLLSPTP